jgi:hypothetical protein
MASNDMLGNPYVMRSEASVGSGQAKIIDNPEDSLVAVDRDLAKPKDDGDELASWVMSRVGQWIDHRRQNYEPEWDEYERLWRSIYAPEDRKRPSERSKLIAPALSEAVENCVAEVEEAIFGRGDFFDITPEATDPEILAKALEKNKIALKEDLSRTDYALNVGECALNGAVFGTGIAEILVQKQIVRDISAAMDAVGGMAPKIEEREVMQTPMRSVHPRNFAIDPNARGVDDALGVAIEEYVGSHLIRKGQKSGEYRDVDIGTDAGDSEITPDKQVTSEYVYDKTHIVRYYGLVPEHLLTTLTDGEEAVEEIVELFAGEDEATEGEDSDSTEPVDGDMVEAIIVIANKKTCIKAVRNPYIMQDRPVVAAQWDVVPGRFWGRGVCEKGLTPQIALDAEIRARIDALAYTAAPMMAMDASRLPRGFKFESYPGKSLLTNGNPKEIFNPMRFGEIDSNTWQQAQALDQMVQRATGSMDGVAMAQRGVGGDARSGAVSMSLAGIVKRHKRTLMRFVDGLLIPSLRKILWRQMQFNAGRYVPVNFTFNATSTMGIMQREYETATLAQLLNTMDPKSREYKMMLMGVVANTGLNSRGTLIEMLQQQIQREADMEQQAIAAQQAVPPVDPMMQQVAMINAELDIAEKKNKIVKLNAETQKLMAETAQIEQENELEALKIATKGIYALDPEDQAAEFDRRYKTAQLALKDKEIAERAADRVSNENIAMTQMVISSSTNNRIRKLETDLEKAKAPRGVTIVKDSTGTPIGLAPAAPEPLPNPPTPGVI